MSKIITHINANSGTYGATIRLATPSEYFHDLHAEQRTYAVHQGTLEPYNGGFPSEAKKGFWTGIYSSRVELKRLDQEAVKTLAAAERFFALATAQQAQEAAHNASSSLCSGISTLRHAVGISQHHDALPGTSNAGTYSGSDPITGGFVVQVRCICSFSSFTIGRFDPMWNISSGL
jgi:hypothetical protein